ncbi:MAG TPA: hypothetical protein VH583_15455 [Vicinamibacterales bacterium]|jgi:hypothetical protein
MLITPWFSFLHMAKTGGSFVQEVLVAQYGDRVTVGYHDPWDRLPQCDQPVLMFVRNPWHWYVSWFHYLRDFYAGQSPEIRASDRIYQTGFGGGAHDFATAVRLACRGEIEVPIPAFQDQIGRYRDLYTAAIMYMVGKGLDDPRLTVGLTEQLREDLIAFVHRADVPDLNSLVKRIRETPINNQSRHDDYRNYYDPALRDQVGRASSWVIDRFGYTFD